MISLQFLLPAFVIVLAPFLSGNATTATSEMVLLGGFCMALTFMVFVFCSCIVAASRQWILGPYAVMRWLNRSSAAIFAALAGRLALERT